MIVMINYAKKICKNEIGDKANFPDNVLSNLRCVQDSNAVT